MMDDSSESERWSVERLSRALQAQKRRIEAERAFREGGRDELADGEAAEALIIGAYLPAELDDAQLAEIVTRAVERSGATSLKDLGSVMGLAMAEVGGRADGKRVSEQVRAALAIA